MTRTDASSPLPPALLLAGGGPIGVSAARSLAALGVRVHVLGGPEEPVRASRACTSYTPVPEGPGLVQRYLEALEEGPRAGVVLPCDDDGVELVARHRATLQEWGYLPVEGDDAIMLAMLDKERTYELSRKIGIPTPVTMTVRSREDAEQAAATFDYPCALKPVHSHLFVQQVHGPDKLYRVTSPDELLAKYDELADLGLEFLVTELIPGPDTDFCSFYSYLLPDGTPLYRLTKHKLRQVPIAAGLTCYQETVREPEVAELGLQFFQGIGLRGVGNVEFKRDSRDGQWKIIECNHRFTLAQEIVRLAGIDVPLIAYRRAVGLPVEPVEDYDLVRMWSPIQDVRSFVQYRDAGELTLSRWVGSLMTRWHLPMLDLRDPLPSVVDVSSELPGLTVSIVERLRTRGALPVFRGRANLRRVRNPLPRPRRRG